MREMKETGVPWLPEVSEDFTVGYVKQFFYVSKDLSNEGEPERVLKLARAGIVEKDISTNEGQMAASYAGYNRVRVGDLLINPMDLYSGANCNVSELNGVISPAYSNLRAKKAGSVVPKFYDYYFKSQYWLMAMFAHGKGVSFDNRWTLNNDSLRAYEIPVAPYAVQQRIVERIQSEERKVDALITNVQAQIEKLKAYKQSVITEVVTKGLDPTVPMKDSGVDRLDRIPMHWRIMKQTMLTTRIGDGLHGTPEFDDSSNIFFINGNNLGEKYITVRENTKSVLSSEYEKYRLDLNDRTLLISLNGTIGSISRYNGEIVVFGKSAGYIIVKDNINIDYLSYYLQTHCVKEIFELSFAGTTINNLSLETLRNLRVCVPPHEEQDAIVVYLDEKCCQIDRLIAIKQEKIEKLEQYKKSLIYEYVTGKKEVS